MSCYVLLPPAGKPVMIITEYMENGSLDTFLKVRWQQEVGKRLPGNQIFFFLWLSVGGVSGPILFFSSIRNQMYSTKIQTLAHFL